MNIRQMQSFVSVVERGSFAAAADALVTTQSTISARIRELERHLGVDLFDRTAHRARLTPKGEQMLLYARQMLDLSNQIDREVGDPGSIGGTVRIGAVGMVVRNLTPRLVGEVRRRFPNLRIKMDGRLARSLLNMLEDAEIDLALVNAPAAIEDVETLTIGRDRFVWMAADALGVPDETLTPRQLLSWPILGFPEESHHFPITSKWFAADNAVYAPAIASSDMDVLAAPDLAVESHRFVAVVIFARNSHAIGGITHGGRPPLRSAFRRCERRSRDGLRRSLPGSPHRS